MPAHLVSRTLQLGQFLMLPPCAAAVAAGCMTSVPCMSSVRWPAGALRQVLSSLTGTLEGLGGSLLSCVAKKLGSQQPAVGLLQPAADCMVTQQQHGCLVQ